MNLGGIASPVSIYILKVIIYRGVYQSRTGANVGQVGQFMNKCNIGKNIYIYIIKYHL